MIRGEAMAWLVLMLLWCSAQQQSVTPLEQAEAKTGLIDGTVIYADGKPVKAATVYAVPLGRPLGAIIPHANTDETGHFAIHIFPSWFGKFAVAAKKETEDYADMSDQFYGDGKFDTVTLSSVQRSATVTIRLGIKAGVLLVTVKDAQTGAPLNPCIELRRASEPNNFVSGTGLVTAEHRLLVPANAGILMRVWLDGYKPWYYPGAGDESSSRALRMKPAEKKMLDILMRADTASSESGCPTPLETTVNSR